MDKKTHFECSLCKKWLPVKTSYRKISVQCFSQFKYIFLELGYTFKALQYLCRPCEGVLKKRDKLEKEYAARQDITKHLLQSESQIKTTSPAKTGRFEKRTLPSPSPVKFNHKRAKHTPAKRILFESKKDVSTLPSLLPDTFTLLDVHSLQEASPGVSQTTKQDASTCTDASVVTQTLHDHGIQCGNDFEMKTDVKITWKSPSGIRICNVSDPTLIAVCKAVANRHGPERIARLLSRDDKYMDHITNEVCEKLQKDCCLLASKQFPSLLLQKDADSLQSILTYEIFQEWEERSSIFTRVLESLTIVDKGSVEKNEAAMLAAGCIALFNRNPEMSRLHTAIGLVLDECGTTDEGLDIMNAYGLSVSSKTVQRRRTALIKKHTELCQEMYGDPKADLESACLSQAALADHCLAKMNGENNSHTRSILHDTTILSEMVPQSVGYVDSVLSYGENIVPLFSLSGQHRVFIQDDKKVCSDRKEYVINYTVFSDQPLEGPICPDVSFIKEGKVCDFEVLGDNFDLMIDRTVMSKSRQRKSVHWFLLIAKKKSITFPQLRNDKPKRDIMKISTNEWLPAVSDIDSYHNDLDFHTAHVMVQYLDFLKPFKKCMPKCIPHPYLKEVSKKTELLTCDILDESENSNEGMININKRIHKDFVPKDENGEVADRIVFGGDVLTNERAFTAQQHVINGHTSFSRTAGVIHRPEGLHRQMNLVLLIYQLLYKESASAGSLYALRNRLNRRNVTGPDEVVKAFRPHQKFLDDVLHGFIVAASQQHFGMETLSSDPSRNRPSALFHMLSGEDQYKWIATQARTIREHLTLHEPNTSLQVDMETHNIYDQQMMAYKDNDDNKYHCPHCPKKYVKTTGLEKHMRIKHDEDLSVHTAHPGNDADPTIPTMIKLLYLQYDTTDSFKYGDGDRAFRNAKLEFLYLFAGKHTKYRLWLWRMLSYEMALLSPRKAMEYKWNIAVNTGGGLGRCIPNDNFVEIQVKNIKQTMARQGPNKSFDTAKAACKTTQVVCAVRDSLKMSHKNSKKSNVDITEDVVEIATAVKQAGCIENPGIEVEGLETFHEPLAQISASELHQWIRKQKEIANNYMV